MRTKAVKVLVVAGAAAGVVGGAAGVASGDVFRFDFGAASGNGAETVSPDANGNFWNNVTGPVTEDVVNIDDAASDLVIRFTSDFSANNLGGLTAPDSGLLGDFAVGSVTGDYFFGAGSFVTSFEVEGLDAGVEYNLRFFATRATGETRTTEYTAVGGNGSHSVQLQTSGDGAGAGSNGNNDDLALIVGITADGSGEIAVSFTRVAGGFSYLGGFEIEVVPTPGSAAMLAVGGLLSVRRRR
ncbi:MAG: hypothetical protein AAF297_02135 [Planctomycetota bacterium]